MEKSPPWKVNCSHIYRIWYAVHNNPPLVPRPHKLSLSIPSYPISFRYALILYSHLCLHLLCGLFPSGFSTKPYMHIYVSYMHVYVCVCVRACVRAPCPLHLLSLYHPNNISWTVQIKKHFIMQVFCPVTSSTLVPNILLIVPDSYQVFIYIPTKYAKYWQMLLHILNLKWLTYT